MSELHPIFTGILATFAQNYEAKILAEDSDDERRRDAAEAVLAARQVQEEEDAKAEFRLQSATEDYLRDIRDPTADGMTYAEGRARYNLLTDKLISVLGAVTRTQGDMQLTWARHASSLLTIRDRYSHYEYRP
jgi:hypothetical protein